jgi:putative transposase
MPDHMHLLMTVRADMTIEKAMQLIKGAFSYRIKKEFGYLGAVWQKGISEVRASTTTKIFSKSENTSPVKAGLAGVPISQIISTG